MVNKIVANKYYIYTKPQEKLIFWDIYELNPENCGFVAYFGKVFQVIEKNLQKKGLTFYVTMSEINELPSYGDNVVVFILEDELCRIPKYTHKVGAVFKCYGTNQILGCNPFLNPSYLNLVTTIKFLKNWAIRLPEMVNYKFHKFKSLRLGKRKITPIFDIPLGYFNSEDLPIKNMQERLYDVFFAGSVVHTHYPIWSLHIKYGCIVITEALPQRWFYKNSPAIQMKDWQHLEAVLENLLQNQEYMEEMHQKSLHWWKNKCSETVVGEYISKELNHLFYR